MKYKLELHYSVMNCGDGSAYPIFFATGEEAELHQDYLTEGWGEPCTGVVIVNSNSPIECDSFERLCKKHPGDICYFGVCEECESEKEEDKFYSDVTGNSFPDIEELTRKVEDEDESPIEELTRKVEKLESIVEEFKRKERDIWGWGR